MLEKLYRFEKINLFALVNVHDVARGQYVVEIRIRFPCDVHSILINLFNLVKKEGMALFEALMHIYSSKRFQKDKTVMSLGLTLDHQAIKIGIFSVYQIKIHLFFTI